MKPATLVLAVVLMCSTAAGQSDTGIVAPNASFEKLCDGGSFTEGPAMGPDGCVYFSDLTFDSGSEDGHIWRYDPVDGSCHIVRSPSGMSNGIEFDPQGRMITAHGSDYGGRGLERYDFATRKGEILAAQYDGKPLNSPNDLVLDSQGRIYFTDPRYGDRSSVVQPVMGVYRLDPEGKVTLLIPDIPNPNGIALSPDERTLYVGCAFEGAASPPSPPMNALLAYTVAGDGSMKLRDTVASYPGTIAPDGFAVDQQGHVYVALRDETSPGIAVYASDGMRVAYIPTPEVPSNAAFGRPPGDSVLYITAGGSLYRIQTRQHGWFSSPWQQGSR